jgi:hypothetical protein
MKSRNEIENKIWAINYALTKMKKIKPSHPDYPEDVRARKILLDRIKKLQEKLEKT